MADEKKLPDKTEEDEDIFQWITLHWRDTYWKENHTRRAITRKLGPLLFVIIKNDSRDFSLSIKIGKIVMVRKNNVSQDILRKWATDVINRIKFDNLSGKVQGGNRSQIPGVERADGSHR